ncbi:dynein light chain Tctex-type 5-like [Haliotis rubra]|uniref:dynein light chain Tctex-type 5-like n=1 Tax=Haliotis rubra TaxID=36100 RepID=UPI001EE63436|nr:dynein light chain Tctex-type 5-like [Haliotis rubra]
MSEVKAEHRSSHHGRSEKDHHHGKDHHSTDHHSKDKHPTLRGATINPVQTGMTGGRPRAGTFGRKDTAHSIASNRDKHVRDHDRHSVVTDDHHHPMIMYENTYKMEPDARFKEGEVKQIIRAVLKDHITENVYECGAMKTKSMMLSNKILEQVKKLEMKRFKFVCFVMIGEKGSQSMQFSSRCLWDQRYDNYTTTHVTQGNIHATGIVYAVYAE